MLELIFQGFVEWIYGMVLECWQFFSAGLLDIMSLDFDYLKTHIPVLSEIQQILLAAGWALLLGNLIFQSLKSMATGLGFEGEDPKLLFTRTFVFAFLLLASPQICEIGLNLTQSVINYLGVPDAVNITFADEATFSGLSAAWLLVVICGLIIMFKVLKLVVEIAERYIILAILTLCAPLAFGVGGSRNTSDIFSGWCRMFGSMCLVMVTNVIFFKMLLSVLSFIPSGLDVLPWMVLVFGIVKVAKKIDAIITRIGLNPAITGDSLGGRSFPGMLTYAVVRAVGQQVAKSAGNNIRGRGRSGGMGHSPGSGPDGPRSGPGSGGAYFAGAAGTGSRTAGATVQSGQQVHAAQNTQVQSSNSSHAGVPQAEPAGSNGTEGKQQHAGAASFVSGTTGRTQTSASHSNSSQHTSVAPGTLRGTSHVPTTTQPDMAGTGTVTRGVHSVNQVSGMRSATAGSRSAMVGTAAGRGQSPAAGMAEKAPAQPARFTAVSSQQVNEGSADSRITAAEQNHIAMSRGAQSRGAALPGGQATVPSERGGVNRDLGTTRFTRRQTQAAPAFEKSAATGSKSSVPQTAPASEREASSVPASTTREAGTVYPQPGRAVPPIGGAVMGPSAARHGRNGLNGDTDRHGGRPLRSAQQVRPPSRAGQTAKAPDPPLRSGTAGMGVRTKTAARAEETGKKQVSASKSTPSAVGTTGGRRPSSGTPARQERRSLDSRGNVRWPKNGGVKDGK